MNKPVVEGKITFLEEQRLTNGLHSSEEEGDLGEPQGHRGTQQGHKGEEEVGLGEEDQGPRGYEAQKDQSKATAHPKVKGKGKGKGKGKLELKSKPLPLAKEKGWVKGSRVQAENLVAFSDWIVKSPRFKYLRLNSATNTYYLYNETEKVYTQTDRNGFRRILNKYLRESGITLHYKSLDETIHQMGVDSEASIEDLRQQSHHVNFRNGILDLNSGELMSHTPEIFTCTRLDFDYNKHDLNPKQWLKYLEDFTQGSKETIEYLRAWIKCLLHGYTGTQTFLTIVGPGGTGKSVFGNVCISLVGRQGVLSTSMKLLNDDKFESSNLINKRLIVMSDAASYSGDVTMLKALTGDDIIKGRKKNVQGSYDFFCEAPILIITNYLLESTDSSGGLERRSRIVEAKNVVNQDNAKILLRFTTKGWEGALKSEISGIFNWAFEMPLEKAISTVLKENPGKDLLQGTNPLKNWLQEETEETEGGGSYIGFITKDDVQTRLRIRQGKFLYPFYSNYCKQRGYKTTSHKLFSRQIVDQAEFTITKIDRRDGTFLKGIKLRDDVVERGLDYMGPIEAKQEDLVKAEEQDKMEFANFKKRENPERHEKFINPYIELLNISSLKKKINKVMKRNMPDPNTIIKLYLKDVKVKDPAFKQKVTEVVTKNYETMVTHGCIPYHYKQMGTSPRILPKRYGDTINNVKKIYRNEIYKVIPKHFPDYCIIDFDLVSCYNSILLGLYPNELEYIRQAVEGSGLWAMLEEEFIRAGRGEDFNKPAVKVCVYSSFFLGGSKAMMTGIIKNRAKELGYQEETYKNLPGYEEVYKQAAQVADFMMNSSVILLYLEVAAYIRKTFDQKYMVGPTGHYYLVSDQEAFRTAYPNYLQSYEFYILSQASLRLKEKYPDVEFIGHYHDGNTLAVPKAIASEVKAYYAEQVTAVGKEIYLAYSQKLEVQAEYGLD